MQSLPDQTPVSQDSNTTSQSRLREAPYRPFLQVPWSKRDVGWGVVVGLVLLVGMDLLLSLGLRVVLRSTGAKLPAVTGLVTLLVELVLLLPVWWFGVRKYRLPWSSVGLRGFAFARGLGMGCLFLLVAIAFNMAWSLLLSLFGLSTQPDLLSLFGGGIGGLLLALFTGGIIAPIAEEVFFRGFIFAGLYRHLGLRRAVVLSAALFALVHILPTSWPPIFLLGVVFALLYDSTGSIWPAVALHGAVNSISFLVLYWVGGLSH
jgi:membrane protease YdiL (CAAX protease family)